LEGSIAEADIVAQSSPKEEQKSCIGHVIEAHEQKGDFKE
jgi:hypothetical protein